jgi:outer membrane protein OmpA-like peptidoglycan-associated protein
VKLNRRGLDETLYPNFASKGEAIMLIHTCSTRRGFFFITVFFISSILSLDGVVAQEGVKTEILNIVPKTLDIEFQVEDLKGATKDIEVKETETEIKIELSGDILFDFDKWNIRPAAEPVLQKVADVIKQYPSATVLIEGYTDSKGSDSYNLRLSDRRAVSVKDWLLKKGGVKPRRMTTRGWGEANPVAPNTNPDGSDNPEGRQKNRRVEITVEKG